MPGATPAAMLLQKSMENGDKRSRDEFDDNSSDPAAQSASNDDWKRATKRRLPVGPCSAACLAVMLPLIGSLVLLSYRAMPQTRGRSAPISLQTVPPRLSTPALVTERLKTEEHSVAATLPPLYTGVQWEAT